MDLNMYRMERAVERLFERVFCVFRAVQEGALKLGKKGIILRYFMRTSGYDRKRQTAIFSLKSCVRNIPRTSFHLKNTVSVLREMQYCRS